MGNFDALLAARYITQRYQRAREAGVELRLVRDLRQVYGAVLPGKSWTPLFDPARHDLVPSQTFLLEGRAGDRIVFTQASRLIDLGTSSLAEYWVWQLGRLYPEQPPANAASLSPTLQRISGRVVYYGEGWIDRDFGGRDGLGAALIEAGMAIGHATWQADWLAGLMVDKLVRNGHAARSGAYHFEPLGEAEAQLAPGFILDDDWLIWMHRDDITRAIEADVRRRSRATPPPRSP